jgi:hypothetical protein
MTTGGIGVRGAVRNMTGLRQAFPSLRVSPAQRAGPFTKWFLRKSEPRVIYVPGAANLTVIVVAKGVRNMTKARDLERNDRVMFWRDLHAGPGRKPVNPSPQHQGTVVSIDPLRVLWDNVGVNHDGPSVEYPMGGKAGYKRFEIRALPK